MPCYRPIKGYRSRVVNPTGKRSIVFNKNQGFIDQPVDLPCGRCIGCRLEKARQWAMRCCHEASMHEKNCFITLTYNNENLPKDGSLNKRDFQLFMKRLRKKYGQVRFFHCGEYGEKKKRPHYHALLFGLDFKREKKLVNGVILSVAPELEELWGLGYVVIGDVTFESASYVARYITKKITGDESIEHYMEIDKTTGEVLSERSPEYTTMSRRPGIAAGWFDKYHKEIYGYDSVIFRGKEMKPPKFYDSKYEVLNSEDMKRVKEERKEKCQNNEDFEKRWFVIEKVKSLFLKKNERKYEKDDDFCSV